MARVVAREGARAVAGARTEGVVKAGIQWCACLVRQDAQEQAEPILNSQALPLMVSGRLCQSAAVMHLVVNLSFVFARRASCRHTAARQSNYYTYFEDAA